MASFEERKAEIAKAYIAAAASQNDRLFREALKDHQELVLEEDGEAEDLREVLRQAGRRILGKPVTAESIDELVDLVSNVREDMTDSQRLSLFIEGLLRPATTEAPQPKREWPQPTTASQRRIARFTQRENARSSELRQIDFEDIDMTPNRSIGGAAWGIGLVLTAGLALAGILYLAGQLS